MGEEPEREGSRGYGEGVPRAWGGRQGRGVSVPSGGGVGEGTATQVPLSRRFPLGQVQTGPLGLSRQSHSHFLRSQGLVTAVVGRGRGRMLNTVDPEPAPAHQDPRAGFPSLPTFRLLVLVVQDHVRGMVQAPCQVDQGAVSKLMDLEDTIIDVGDAIDVILKNIDAEGVT